MRCQPKFRSTYSVLNVKAVVVAAFSVIVQLRRLIVNNLCRSRALDCVRANQRRLHEPADEGAGGADHGPQEALQTGAQSSD